MTAQAHEKLIYDGEETSMAFCPPVPEHSRIVKVDAQVRMTSFWRGYIGTWEIKNDRFYLTNLSLGFKLKGDEPLFADWFTGMLRIPKGEELLYVHMGFGTIFERELHIHIKNGLVIKTQEIDNRGKEHDANKLSLDNLPGFENHFPGDDALIKDIIITAIEKAKPGIKKYIEIMKLFKQTNVTTNKEFQKMFNGFYRIQRRSIEWYKTYYDFMENQKGENVTFSETLKYIKNKLNRNEPAFSSKLVATHNPNMPIWDQHVLRNFGLRPPHFNAKNKVVKIEELYKELQERYKKCENSRLGKMIINIFNEQLADEARLITNIKKIDFVLWQIRT